MQLSQNFFFKSLLIGAIFNIMLCTPALTMQTSSTMTAISTSFFFFGLTTGWGAQGTPFKTIPSSGFDMHSHHKIAHHHHHHHHQHHHHHHHHLHQHRHHSFDVQSLTANISNHVALTAIHGIASNNFGTLCVTHSYKTIYVPVETIRYDGIRQKADLAASFIQQVGLNHHGMPDAMCKSLITADRKVIAARILALNATTGTVINSVTWNRPKGSDLGTSLEINGPEKVFDETLAEGTRPDRAFPWYQDAAESPVWSPKFMNSPVNVSFKGWWTYPYYSCAVQKWLMSYSVPLPYTGKHLVKGFLSVDVDISNLEINQCDKDDGNSTSGSREISAFYGTHKCHNTSVCQNVAVPGFIRGGYTCVCKPGYYHKNKVFNGTIVEAAWEEVILNESSTYFDAFVCLKCAPGCRTCVDDSPCLASYNWTLRTILLVISLVCAVQSLVLICVVYYYRRVRVMKVASPVFLGITLVGCFIMYLESVATYPVMDMFTCIVSKWAHHLGFCITYTALLLKMLRVTLTYRVRSAHRVKLTDRKLLKWMFPILLVVVIYLGAWTISDPPTAEMMTDQYGLEFKECTFNWWDHSLAVGEFIFLAWGVRVCFRFRNAESYYNEARLVSYAIYNIAVVNTVVVLVQMSTSLLFVSKVGPDAKHSLGFFRAQMSALATTITAVWPKLYRICRGQGDEWDTGTAERGVTPSASLNRIEMARNPAAALERENDDLKEEIQRLAAQIQVMRIAHMVRNNRHLQPRSELEWSALSSSVTKFQSYGISLRGLSRFRDAPGPSSADDEYDADEERDEEEVEGQDDEEMSLAHFPSQHDDGDMDQTE